MLTAPVSIAARCCVPAPLPALPLPSSAARRASGQTTRAAENRRHRLRPYRQHASGSLWVKAGHPVMFSSRHPEELASLAQGLGAAGQVRDGCRGDRVRRRHLHRGALWRLSADRQGLRQRSSRARWCSMPATRSRRATARSSTRRPRKGHRRHLGKISAGRHIVRAFNTMSYRYFAAQADRAGDRMAIPLAGDDKDALNVASTLVHDAGFDPVIIGSTGARQGFRARRSALWPAAHRRGNAPAGRSTQVRCRIDGICRRSISPSIRFPSFPEQDDRRQAERGAGAGMVLALYLLAAVVLLHHASDSRPDGGRGRRQ